MKQYIKKKNIKLPLETHRRLKVNASAKGLEIEVLTNSIVLQYLQKENA